MTRFSKLLPVLVVLMLVTSPLVLAEDSQEDCGFFCTIGKFLFGSKENRAGKGWFDRGNIAGQAGEQDSLRERAEQLELEALALSEDAQLFESQGLLEDAAQKRQEAAVAFEQAATFYDQNGNVQKAEANLQSAERQRDLAKEISPPPSLNEPLQDEPLQKEPTPQATGNQDLFSKDQICGFFPDKDCDVLYVEYFADPSAFGTKYFVRGDQANAPVTDASIDEKLKEIEERVNPGPKPVPAFGADGLIDRQRFCDLFGYDNCLDKYAEYRINPTDYINKQFPPNSPSPIKVLEKEKFCSTLGYDATICAANYEDYKTGPEAYLSKVFAEEKTSAAPALADTSTTTKTRTQSTRSSDGIQRVTETKKLSEEKTKEADTFNDGKGSRINKFSEIMKGNDEFRIALENNGIDISGLQTGDPEEVVKLQLLAGFTGDNVDGKFGKETYKRFTSAGIKNQLISEIASGKRVLKGSEADQVSTLAAKSSTQEQTQLQQEFKAIVGSTEEFDNWGNLAFERKNGVLTATGTQGTITVEDRGGIGVATVSIKNSDGKGTNPSLSGQRFFFDGFQLASQSELQQKSGEFSISTIDPETNAPGTQSFFFAEKDIAQALAEGGKINYFEDDEDRQEGDIEGTIQLKVDGQNTGTFTHEKTGFATDESTVQYLTNGQITQVGLVEDTALLGKKETIYRKGSNGYVPVQVLDYDEEDGKVREVQVYENGKEVEFRQLNDAGQIDYTLRALKGGNVRVCRQGGECADFNPNTQPDEIDAFALGGVEQAREVITERKELEALRASIPGPVASYQAKLDTYVERKTLEDSIARSRGLNEDFNTQQGELLDQIAVQQQRLEKVDEIQQTLTEEYSDLFAQNQGEIAGLGFKGDDVNALIEAAENFNGDPDLFRSTPAVTNLRERLGDIDEDRWNEVLRQARTVASNREEINQEIGKLESEQVQIHDYNSFTHQEATTLQYYLRGDQLDYSDPATQNTIARGLGFDSVTEYRKSRGLSPEDDTSAALAEDQSKIVNAQEPTDEERQDAIDAQNGKKDAEDKKAQAKGGPAKKAQELAENQGVTASDVAQSVYAVATSVRSYSATSNLLFGGSDWYGEWTRSADQAFAPKLGSNWFPSAICESHYDIEPEGKAVLKTVSGTYQPVASIQIERSAQQSIILCEREQTDEGDNIMTCGEGRVCQDDLCYADENEDQEPDNNEPLQGYFYKITWGVSAPSDEAQTPLIDENGVAVSFNVWLDGTPDEKKTQGALHLYSLQGNRVNPIQLNNGASDSDTVIQYSAELYQEACIVWDQAPLTVTTFGTEKISDVCFETVVSEVGEVNWKSSGQPTTTRSNDAQVETSRI